MIPLFTKRLFLFTFDDKSQKEIITQMTKLYHWVSLQCKNALECTLRLKSAHWPSSTWFRFDSIEVVDSTLSIIIVDDEDKDGVVCV